MSAGRETLAEARRADRVSARSRRLAQLVIQRSEVDAEISSMVVALRRDGVSWAIVGGVLGVSRQAAEQRYSVKSS